MKNIKLSIINFLKSINLFNFIYSKIIFIRRFLSKKTKINFRNNFILIEDKNSDNFLGYYDISNFSNDRQKISFHQKTKLSNYVNICVYNRDKRSVDIYDTSAAWSWQLGSRLKWLSDKELIFNCIDDNKNLICRTINIENKSSKNFSYPFFQ